MKKFLEFMLQIISKRKSDAGFSLLEMTISVGLATTVAIVVADIAKINKDTVIKLTSIASRGGTQSLVKSLLTSNNCNLTVKNLGSSINMQKSALPNLNLSVINLLQYDPLNPTIGKATPVNVNAIIDGIKINSMNISNCLINNYNLDTKKINLKCDFVIASTDQSNRFALQKVDSIPFILNYQTTDANPSATTALYNFTGCLEESFAQNLAIEACTGAGGTMSADFSTCTYGAQSAQAQIDAVATAMATQNTNLSTLVSTTMAQMCTIANGIANNGTNSSGSVDCSNVNYCPTAQKQVVGANTLCKFTDACVPPFTDIGVTITAANGPVARYIKRTTSASGWNSVTVPDKNCIPSDGTSTTYTTGFHSTLTNTPIETLTIGANCDVLSYSIAATTANCNCYTGSSGTQVCDPCYKIQYVMGPTLTTTLSAKVVTYGCK